MTMVCPRCEASVEEIPLEGGHSYKECSVCTWPNESFEQMETTLACTTPSPDGDALSVDALEDFAASLTKPTTLRDPQGRIVMAKAVSIRILDDAVNVVFEFDPEGWKHPSSLD